MTMQNRERLREIVDRLTEEPLEVSQEMLEQFRDGFYEYATDRYEGDMKTSRERRLQDTMKMYNLFPVSAEYIANQQHETRRRPLELGARFRPVLRLQDRESFKLIEQILDGELLQGEQRDPLPVNLPEISPSKLRTLKSSAGRVLIGALPSTSRAVELMATSSIEVLTSNVYDLDKVITSRLVKAYDLYFGGE